jgi:hypothetical protein
VWKMQIHDIVPLLPSLNLSFLTPTFLLFTCGKCRTTAEVQVHVVNIGLWQESESQSIVSSSSNTVSVTILSSKVFVSLIPLMSWTGCLSSSLSSCPDAGHVVHLPYFLTSQ